MATPLSWAGLSTTTYAGAAWVWTRTGGVWTQQGSKLVGTGGAVGAAYQGASVALSSDGNTAIVGGYPDNAGTGAAWVFTRSNGVWTPRQLALSEHHASDAAYRVAPLVRTSAGILLQPFRGAGALPIRAIGPYYVASARELERYATDLIS